MDVRTCVRVFARYSVDPREHQRRSECRVARTRKHLRTHTNARTQIHAHICAGHVLHAAKAGLIVKSLKNRTMLIVNPFLQGSSLHLFLSFLLLFTLPVPIPIRGQNSTGWSLTRPRRQYIDGPDSFHSLGGVNEDGQARAPLVLEVTHNLTVTNGPKGRCGICARTYRVLKDLQYKPSVECQRYWNSRQGALGDLTEFYHTVNTQVCLSTMPVLKKQTTNYFWCKSLLKSI